MQNSSELKKVKAAEERILKEEQEIKRTEEHIRTDEKKIIESEQVILGSIKKHPIRAFLPGGFNTRELGIIKAVFTRRFTKHKLIVSIVATIGVVLVWRGIWHTADALPVVSISLVSLIMGVMILWLIKRYTDL